MSNVYIYVLVCPDTDKVMYVGKTVNPENRLYQHINESKNGYYSLKTKWIFELLMAGKNPVMKIIEICSPDQWSERELYWINHYGSLEGSQLTNNEPFDDACYGNALIPISTRLPKPLYDSIAEMAAKNRRSFNSQAVLLLQEIKDIKDNQK